MLQKTVLTRVLAAALLAEFSFYGLTASEPSMEGSDTPPAIEDEAPNFFKQLKSNSRFNLNGHFDFFRRHIPAKKKTYGDLILRGQSFGNIASSTTLNTNAYGAYTNSTGAMRGGLSDPKNLESSSKSFDFIEMYAKTQFQSFDLSIGKVLLSNSVSEIASITDIYNPINVAGFQTPITVGNWMTRVDYYTAKEDQITVALLPFAVGSNSVSNGATRWYNNYGGYAEPLGFNLASGATTSYESYRKPTPNHFNFFAKYSGSRGGIDFFAATYYGTSPFAILKNTSTTNHYTIVHPEAAHLSGGVSKIIENWRIYGEALYQNSRQSKDDSFYEVLGGVFGKHTGSVPNALGFQEIDTTLEVSHDETTHHQARNGQFLSSSKPLRNSANSVTGQLTMIVQPGLSAFVGSNYNYQDEGNAYFIGTEVYLSETFFLHLSYTAFDGKAGSAYASCDNNKNTQLSFNWRF